ncbi:hypothetical protein [Streptomyces sp. NBC_01789]|uniref:hypothetical protein n=1 Tax=Streptomyces sp. NBC_01789 TaxID=2975941 RepID=UPI0022511FA9|nr:hypothetical protein [Streptomyces sp. NBC_01789]MCX4451630.1 hypothetical protein [Streptomyces sp. NBC_01789]
MDTTELAVVVINVALCRADRRDVPSVAKNLALVAVAMLKVQENPGVGSRSDLPAADITKAAAGAGLSSGPGSVRKICTGPCVQ